MEFLTQNDIEQFDEIGISEQEVLEQIELLKNNNCFLKIEKAATLNDGIKNTSTIDGILDFWKLIRGNYNVAKFVPASGAATRMFNRLIKYYNELTEKNYKDGGFYSVENTIKNIEKFAFAEKINIDAEPYKIVEQILYSPLNYIDIPKGLVSFHKNEGTLATPFEEHIKEGLLLNLSGDMYSDYRPTKIHFTISKNFENKFQTKLNEIIEQNNNYFDLDVSFSVQQESTNTVAIYENGDIVRDENGRILFRPGGHGSLLQNLNNLESTIVFINNIDNVACERDEYYANIRCGLGGLLIYFVNKIHMFFNKMDSLSEYDCINYIKSINSEFKFNIPKNITKEKLKNCINRPIRICGMVKNTGETGGGPFWVKDKNDNISLQIVEKSQINLNDPEQKKIFESSTHFNPVDMVCYLKDCEGKKFDLTKYVDKNTSFVAEKTYNGKKIKILEHPGLWNGAMADWLTVFVEIPIDVFNPVKELNDLLKREHQPKE